MKPKKTLGQHWLFDSTTLAQIVEAAELTDQDTVLEVGPGLGTLTELLVKKAKLVVAVEKDEELAGKLKNNQTATNLTVVPADILEFNLTTLPKGYKVVANIPYYLTSKLIRNLLESANPPSMMVLLVQKEVAERIVAQPPQMSILAFSVQYYAQAQIVAPVAKELFTPPPKVDSAIIKISRRPKPAFDADIKKLFRIVKAGFSSKRKQLRNSLAAGLQLEPAEAEKRLVKIGVSSQARAQELNLSQWQAMYQVFRS